MEVGPTVHQIVLAGDVRRLRAGQEYHRGRALFNGALTGDRNVQRTLTLGGTGCLPRGTSYIDTAGSDAVCGDVVRTVLPGDGPGQTLGRHLQGALSGGTPEGSYARVVDDAAPFMLNHVGYDRFAS